MTASQRRLLLTACLACNREAWQPMCALCQDLADDEDEPQP